MITKILPESRYSKMKSVGYTDAQIRMFYKMLGIDVKFENEVEPGHGLEYINNRYGVEQ